MELGTAGHWDGAVGDEQDNLLTAGPGRGLGHAGRGQKGLGVPRAGSVAWGGSGGEDRQEMSGNGQGWWLRGSGGASATRGWWLRAGGCLRLGGLETDRDGGSRGSGGTSMWEWWLGECPGGPQAGTSGSGGSRVLPAPPRRGDREGTGWGQDGERVPKCFQSAFNARGGRGNRIHSGEGWGAGGAVTAPRSPHGAGNRQGTR